MKTYSLYFLRSGDAPDGKAFEPLMCASDVEALVLARQRLAGRPEFDLVEVHFGDERLFTVRRP